LLRYEEPALIDLGVLPAFIAASLVIILSPGADTLLLLRYAIKGGRSDGFQALVGILLGLILVSALLISGVGVLLASLPWGLLALTLLGAGVLLILGVVSLIQGVSLIRAPRLESALDLAPPAEKRKRPLRAAFVTNATNPKVLIFYLAFFPQFLGSASNTAVQLAVLAAVFLAVTIIWLVPLVYAADAMKKVFAVPAVTIGMELGSGVVFLGLAVVLIAQWGGG